MKAIKVAYVLHKQKVFESVDEYERKQGVCSTKQKVFKVLTCMKEIEV